MPDNRTKLLNVVMDSRGGVTSREIQAATNLSYPTVIKWLEVLNVQGLIGYRQVGKSKLWFATEVLQGMDEEDISRLLKIKRLGKEEPHDKKSATKE